MVEAGKKGRSFLDKVAGAFVTEAPDFNNAPATKSPPGVGGIASPIAPSNTATSYSPAPSVNHSSSEFDAGFREVLLQALQDDKLDGYDYLKFKAAVNDLASDLPDEKIRFKSAFAAAKSMGVTKEKLIDTAKHYSLVLDQKLKAFNSDVSEATATRIDAGSAHIKDLDAAIEGKRTEIQRLNQEIEALQKERNALSGQISDDRNQIEARKNSFVNMHASMVQDINNDINKLTLFLA